MWKVSVIATRENKGAAEGANRTAQHRRGELSQKFEFGNARQTIKVNRHPPHFAKISTSSRLKINEWQLIQKGQSHAIYSYDKNVNVNL